MTDDIDDEWSRYLQEQQYQTGHNVFLSRYLGQCSPTPAPAAAAGHGDCSLPTAREPPACEDLNISTHTKTLYLNQPIDTYDLFWKIPIVDYGLPCNGVVHKDMKIVLLSPDALVQYNEKIAALRAADVYYRETVLRQINIVHTKRTKYKDERKVIVGVCKKNIMNARKKIKGAFMNCFTLIVRFYYDHQFREIHVKIFKTGNIEIPGILNTPLLKQTQEQILLLLQPFLTEPLAFVENKNKPKSVLINSDFRCGYFIDRELAFAVLKNKYGLDVSYDPCSYPGVKCKFYYNNEAEAAAAAQPGTIDLGDRKMTVGQLCKNSKYTCVTFTLFRTGSCLISGNCTEEILMFIYQFVRRFLYEEYNDICVHSTEAPVNIKKKVLQKKEVIKMTPEYFELVTQPCNKQYLEDFVFMRDAGGAAGAS